MSEEEMKTFTDVYKTLSRIWSEMREMKSEIISLRTDIDKLIENNQGGRYVRTA